jgi:hypothetical protein
VFSTACPRSSALCFIPASGSFDSLSCLVGFAIASFRRRSRCPAPVGSSTSCTNPQRRGDLDCGREARAAETSRSKYKSSRRTSGARRQLLAGRWTASASRPGRGRSISSCTYKRLVSRSAQSESKHVVAIHVRRTANTRNSGDPKCRARAPSRRLATFGIRDVNHVAVVPRSPCMITVRGKRTSPCWRASRSCGSNVKSGDRPAFGRDRVAIETAVAYRFGLMLSCSHETRAAPNSLRTR